MQHSLSNRCGVLTRERLLLFPLGPQHLFDIFLALQAGKHHFPAAAVAADLKIHAHPQHGEFLAAARMGLFHAQHVAHTDVHGTHPFSENKSGNKLVYYYTPSGGNLQRKQRPRKKVPKRCLFLFSGLSILRSGGYSILLSALAGTRIGHARRGRSGGL